MDQLRRYALGDGQEELEIQMEIQINYTLLAKVYTYFQ